jgi:hypothetical protein
METPDLSNMDNAEFLHDRALVLHRPQKSHRLHMRAPKDDATPGVPRILTKQVRHRLARQAERNTSWTYTQHHNALLSYLKERERASPPGYSTVRRYLRSISQDTDIAKIIRLEGLVVHLRRTLIVQSTISRLLRSPEIRTNARPEVPVTGDYQMHVRDLIDTSISVEDDAGRRFNGTFSPLALAEVSALVCSLTLSNLQRSLAACSSIGFAGRHHSVRPTIVLRARWQHYRTQLQ